MSTMIEVKNLRKNYGDVKAVDGISFHINRGEIYGFLGPNGAGKTTTINILIGLAKISSGSIWYNGEDLTRKIKKEQRMIGVVADESNLYDEMSGYDNLCFCGSLYGLAKEQRIERANLLLEEFGLKEAAHRKFQTYSKGMKRKLTIAAALIHKPEVLFLDEPTTGIDVESVRQIRTLIKTLNEKGTTIFLTTHYIEEAERLCSRVAFINKGRILKEDTVSALLQSTQESYIIEIIIEENPAIRAAILEQLKQAFPTLDCTYVNNKTIRVISKEMIDISPLVVFLSQMNVFICEAKLIRPTLEEAFVKITGIDIALIKKEKEKK